MKNLQILILTLFLFVNVVDAQIFGTIIDSKTLEPLIGANVELAVNNTGAVTDLDGYFRLEMAGVSNNDTLIFSYLGYQDLRIPINDFKNKSVISLIVKSLELDEGIEVIGERIDITKQDLPTLTEKLSSKQIENYAVGDMKAVVNKIPAVRMVGNDIDGSYFEIRGSNPNEVNVYVDGISINTLSFSNQADMNIISPESIENIKIQKGGNLLLRGMGATGGVVFIDSKVPAQTDFQFIARMGEFENERYTGIINLPIGNNVAVNYSGTVSKSRPELTYEVNRFDPDRTDSYNILTKKQVHNFNGYYFDRQGKITAKIIYFQGINDKIDWKQDRSVYLLGLTYMGKLLGWDNWHLTFNQNYTHDIIDRYIPDQSDLSFNFDYHSDQQFIHLQKVFNYKLITMTGAYDYFHDELRQISSMQVDDTKSQFFADLTYDNQHSLTAVFNFLDTTATQENLNYNVYTSLRSNWWASGQTDFVSNIGMKVFRQMNQRRWEFFSTYGRNVKYPTLLENAQAGDILFFGPGQETGLEKLKPEYIKSADIGVRYMVRYPYPYIPRLTIDAAFFWNEVENKVIRQPIDNIMFLIQDGKNNSSGGDFAIRFGDFANIGDVGMSFLFINTSNKLLYAYKPETNFRLWFEFARLAGFYSTATLFHDGISLAWYYDIDNNLITREIPPFWDIDLVVGWKGSIAKLEYNLQLSGRNILDNSEYVDYYLKRRYFQISLSLKY